EGAVVAQDAPIAGAEDDVVLLDLAFAALAAALDDGLAEWSHAPHVVAGELPAAGVRGQRATGPELAVLDERPAFALLAEAVVLQGGEDGVGVAVVQLADVAVLGADASHREGGPGGELRAGLGLGVGTGAAM